MAEAGNYQGRRLRAAVQAAFADLGELGFRLREPHLDAWRGSDLTVASDTVTILIQADWMERELAVWVTVVGAGPLPIDSLLPETRGTLRLPRNATRGVLQRRLERILRAVKNGAPELLDGGAHALDRVLRAGAEPA